jgi:hypothetical protein
MKLIDEIYTGKSKCAFFFVCIGKDFQSAFKKITLPYYLEYCKKYDIGIITINDYIDKDYKKHKIYEKDPGYQRLLAPSLIKKKFPNYKYICDIDVDCIPGASARNIFKHFKSIKRNEIHLVKPNPETYTESDLGKRISLLRKYYLDRKFPLNSIIIAEDVEKSKIFGYKYKGPIATIGTCLGTTETMSKSGLECYKNIIYKKNFEYLQSYRIDYYFKKFDLKWLPYKYQATWSYEVALYYPFLYLKSNRKNFHECFMSTLSRVDFLHFAGSWPENKYFYKLNYFNKGGLSKFYQNIQSYLAKKINSKSYGRIKFNKKFII